MALYRQLGVNLESQFLMFPDMLASSISAMQSGDDEATPMFSVESNLDGLREAQLLRDALRVLCLANVIVFFFGVLIAPS